MKKLGFRQLWNLTFCAFGIQFGSALQMANMSSIYKFLGAHAGSLAYLWLAAPITGLIGQPLVGYLSDRTTSRFGRRRPYMLIWAICAFVALFLMPNVSALWMAALLLWLLDFSNNGATEPFRALISDTTTPRQRVGTFAMQAAFSGAGATLAASLPWLLQTIGGIHPQTAGANGIPLSIKLAFYIGGTMFLLAVIWTVRTTPETPLVLKKKRETRRKKTPLKQKFLEPIQTILQHIAHMPETIRKFYAIQLFTWMGLFCMWLYFSVAVAQNVFGLPVGATVPHHPALIRMLARGTAWGGVCFATYQFFSIGYAMMLPMMVKHIGFKMTHGVSLLGGAVGLVSVGFIHTPALLLISMVGVGMAWGSIMTMPYTIISFGVPKEKYGIYMGIFNMTITIPQIICALFLGILTKDIFHNNAVELVMFGGFLLCIAGAITVFQSIAEPDYHRIPGRFKRVHHVGEV